MEHRHRPRITHHYDAARKVLTVVTELDYQPAIDTRGEEVSENRPGLAKTDRKVVPLHETLRRVG